MRAPAGYFKYRGVLFKVNPALVAAAQGAVLGGGRGRGVVSHQEILSMAGWTLVGVAGLLGLGIGYLLRDPYSLPHQGEPSVVIPRNGKVYRGPWGGLTRDGEDLYVGDRRYNPDGLLCAGAVGRLPWGGHGVDAQTAIMHPDILARMVKYRKGHDRHGYQKRKGGA